MVFVESDSLHAPFQQAVECENQLFHAERLYAGKEPESNEKWNTGGITAGYAGGILR